jgi:hypothetical protein
MLCAIVKTSCVPEAMFFLGPTRQDVEWQPTWMYLWRPKKNIEEWGAPDVLTTEFRSIVLEDG